MLLDLNSGFEIDWACCVDEAFKKLSAKKYDVVVSDYEMPQKNGLDFLKELKEQKNKTPFILFTGKGREEVAIQALNLGADGYFNKQGRPETVYGELAYGIMSIVDHSKAELALVENELKFRTLADSSINWVYWINPDGSLVFVSPATEKITGYTTEEFIKNPQLIQQIVDSKDSEVVIPHFNELSKEGTHECEFQIKTKNGETKWISHICNPVFDSEGKWRGRSTLNIDITERKKAEQGIKRTMDQLVLVNEKLGVVGRLTRHDVGNKLMTAKSNLYLLKKRIGDNPYLVKYLDNIDSALESSDRIFEFSRLYERIGVEKPSKENVFDCFNQAVALMPNLGDFEVVNECKDLEVVADSLLKQLFYNFIDNSLKHGEKVTQIRLHYTLKDDGVKLIYEDNGVGVPEANKSKLFEAGFSTGKGSGLGLHLVKKMMDVYGWTIAEEGEEGKGVKFAISIPSNSVSSFDKISVD